MKGILSQSMKCCIIPITSECDTETRETNKVNNLLRALKINNSPYIILMDSDVVIGNDKMIEEMLNDMANMNKDIVLVTTRKEKLIKCSYAPHSLMLIKGLMLMKLIDFLEDIEIDPNKDNKSNCSVCKFLADKGNDCVYLENEKNEEVERLDVNKFNPQS